MLNTLSEITLEIINELAIRNQTPTREDLVELLEVKPQVTALLQGHSDRMKYYRDKSDQLTQKVDQLTAQVKSSREKRENLISQLDISEKQSHETEALYRRLLPQLVQLLKTDENRHLDKHLDTLNRLVKNGAAPDQLMDEFKKIRKITFKTDVADTPKANQGKKSSALLKWLKKEAAPSGSISDAPDALSQTIEIYQSLLEELRLNLDSAGMKALGAIHHQLMRVTRLDGLFKIRTDIFSLLSAYINRISNEREQAAAFIREIGERLVQMEKQLINSLAFAKETEEENTSFTQVLELRLKKFHETVDFTKTLDELKTAVVSSLTSLETVVEKKHRVDTSRIELANKRMQSLKEALGQLKGQVQSTRQRAEKLESELLMDALTGIFNRRAYDRRLDEELKRFKRYGHVFSIILFDMDHFKKINDQYGHSVGDLCLTGTMDRIHPLLRETDFLARYGGEEFVALLPETQISGAMGVAEKLRALIEKTDFIHKADTVHVTMSFGVTEVRTSDQTVKDIFDRADRALYEAKESGRNRVVRS
ncbi:MAG: diguanylate cyclase [Deltaproteobacteria bacterium]|nr:diguanylate cyclase [Deltaproteobacteria bacterium]